MKILKQNNFEEINDLAEWVITGLRFTRYQYDEAGNDAVRSLSVEEVHQRILAQLEKSKSDILNFPENADLMNMSFYDALQLSFEKIKKNYLNDILPMARGIMRKDSRLEHGVIVSDEVPDEFLDNILALRWKENLKLWLLAHRYEKEKQDNKEMLMQEEVK